jgi:hypothetical protein
MEKRMVKDEEGFIWAQPTPPMIENPQRVRMHPVFTAEPERLIHRGQPDKLCSDRLKVSKAAQELF